MDPNQIWETISGHKWVPLAALVIGLVVRLLKTDTKIPIDIPPRLRVWLAFGLGAASGVLDKVVTGTAWGPAVTGGVVSAILAVLGQNVVVDSLRGGKEFVIPGLIIPGAVPAPGKPVSLKPPPDDKPPPNLPPGMGGVLLVLVLLLAGCGLFYKALDLAADKAKCVVDNQDLPDRDVWIKCAIQDPEKYLELLTESRASTKKALEKQAKELASPRVDAGAEGGAK